jgi:hypothetical protein
MFITYWLYKSKNSNHPSFFIVILLGLLFNPVFPIYLYDKTTWIIIDIIAGLFYVGFYLGF